MVRVPFELNKRYRPTIDSTVSTKSIDQPKKMSISKQMITIKYACKTGKTYELSRLKEKNIYKTGNTYFHSQNGKNQKRKS